MSSKGWVITIAVIGLMVVGMAAFPVPLPPILLPAEVLGTIGGFPLTNTMVAGLLTVLFWFFLSRAATSNMKEIPSGLQNFVEFVVEFLLGTAEQVAGKTNGRRFFPVVGTIFLFIITSNWLGLLPGFGTIGITKDGHGHGFTMQQVGPIAIVPFGKQPAADEHADEHATDSHAGVKPGAPFKAELVPILRSVNTDLNTTLILGIVGFLAIELWGIQSLGLGTFLGKFFNFHSPIEFFLGLIELVTEFARIVSFAFRLFGNVFAGEVLLAVIGFLAPFVAILPFYGLELFVGFIQAAVFGMLVLVFGTLSVAHHGPEAHGEHAEGHH